MTPRQIEQLGLAQVECVALLSTHPLEEAGVQPRMRSSYSERSPQVTKGGLHQGSLLPRLVGKCGDGQKGQREVDNVCGFYRLEQSMP